MSAAALFRFMGRHPDVDDIEELLDLYQAEEGFGAEQRRELKRAYHAKCGKLIRDPKFVRAIESGQRQARRVRQRRTEAAQPPTTRRRESRARRAQRVARTAIQPALISPATGHNLRETIDAVLRPVDVAEEIDNAVEEETEEQSEQSEAHETEQEEEQEQEGEQRQEAEQEDVGGLGGGGGDDDDDDEEVEEEEVEHGAGLQSPLLPISPVRRKVRSAEARVGGGGAGGRSGSGRRSMGSSSRSAVDLRAYERAIAKIRYLAHIEPWRDEQTVVNAAEQMREFDVLIPSSGKFALSWAEVDMVIKMGRRRRVLMMAGSSASQRSGAAGAMMAEGSSPLSSSPTRLDVVADRAEWMASRVSQLIPVDMLAEFDDAERDLVANALREADRNRAKGATDFAAALRAANVPDHSAMERLEDMGSVGDVALRTAVTKEAVHIIDAQEKTDLGKKQAHYNALAISNVMDKMMRTHITGMILAGLCDGPTPNTNLIKRIVAIHREVTRQMLGAVDYLNQGLKA